MFTLITGAACRVEEVGRAAAAEMGSTACATRAAIRDTIMNELKASLRTVQSGLLSDRATASACGRTVASCEASGVDADPGRAAMRRAAR